MLGYVKKIEKALSTKFSFGKRIPARGGWIWNIDNCRVIKVIQDPDIKFQKDFNDLLKYLKKKDSLAVVKIHEFGSIKIKGDECPYWFYVMDKLKPIPHDLFEGMFDELLRRLYNSKKKFPVFISKEFADFLKEAKKLEYTYYDLHSRNIMITDNGKFKFIDLESFIG